jgi:hypothetical protein
MAWFIIQEERKTWLKYIIEADNEEDAFELVDNWKYLGYVDGDTTDSNIVGGPFITKAEALDDIVSYVDG